MKSSSPVVKHLVLIGGGHSHLSVLRHLGMNPVPGLAVTLISRDIVTPYSGALPGYLTGIYQHDEIHIDLRPLAQFAGVRLIQEEVQDIDLDSKRISLRSRPPIEFDLLSLNIGSRPDAHRIPGASKYAIGIKPIDLFLTEWEKVFQAAITRIREQQDIYRLAIVGGGPASVELAFAAQVRIYEELGLKLTEPSRLKIQIISAADTVLGFHNNQVQKFCEDELQRRHIELSLEHRVTKFSKNIVICEEGVEFPADTIVFATGASIPQWPKDIGLNIGEDGFIEVNHHLQSTSHEFVFAAGDAATIKDETRPKSGVYAVRQGKPLAQNLIRFATNKSLKTYRPQKQALALMSMGNKRAIASRGNLFLQGRSIWKLKHAIDTRFLRKFSELPEMRTKLELASGLIDVESEQQLRAHAMRCAGCGAKVAGSVLSEVLEQIPHYHKEDVPDSNRGIEDASRIDLGDGRTLLQSIDQLTAFVNDPWLFARIATNHCLSDIYAMGSVPHSALAVVGLPFANKKYTRSQLQEIMLGCSSVLEENDCTLLGGHSAETNELSFGLCVNGFAREDALLTKSGMRPGDVIILTKPLGTGTLLAADMRQKASHNWMDAALKQMCVSSKAASQCLVEHGANACTDITGFGLAGHLVEMIEADNVEVELELNQLPILDGALTTIAAGIISSLHADNSHVSDYIQNQDSHRDDPRYGILFDPQTAGGLLASIDRDSAKSCLKALHKAGYNEARVIGTVLNSAAEAPAILLK